VVCVYIFCFYFSEENFSLSGFFGPFRCLIPTPGLTSEYPICAGCVRVCVYTHIHPHTLPSALKIETEEGTVDKDMDAIYKVSVCRRKDDAEPEDADQLDKILTEYPNDIGAGRIKLTSIPVEGLGLSAKCDASDIGDMPVGESLYRSSRSCWAHTPR